MIAPAGDPTSFPPAISSLQIRFPTVDAVHFRGILDNRFRPENLIKLSSAFIQTTRRQKSITLGSLTMIPVREDDGEAAECKGLAAIMEPLGIYFQALLHFCPDEVVRELGHSPTPLYRPPVYGQPFPHPGVLEGLLLHLPPEADAFTKVGGNPQAAEICNN